MKMLSNLVLLVFFMLFTGCTQSSYVFKDNKISLNSVDTDENIASLNIDKKNIKYTNDFCTRNSYTISQDFEGYGNLFIENVELKQKCTWHGLSRGMYETFLKEKSNIKTMSLIKRIDIGTYEFSQYLVDDKYKLNLVFIWSGLKSTFIIDAQGNFSSMLLSKLSSKSTLAQIEQAYNLEFNSSIVRANILGEYFGIEDKSDEEIDIIVP